MITFCTALMNRGVNFRNLYQTMRPLLERGHQWWVADFGSTDIRLEELPRLQVLPLPLPFHKTAALNQLARVASSELLFFLDADMLVPADLDQKIENFVGRKRTYFPICYSLREGRPPVVAADNGWWRRTGYGNCGILRTDLERLGGWDLKYRSWGKEDDDLHARCRRHGLAVRRENCEGFFHQWHPNDLAFKNRYYLRRQPST